MLKTYHCHKYNEAVYNLSIGKFRRRVEFSGGSVPDYPSFFSTSDPITQLALENSPKYGKEFRLVKAQHQPGDPEPVAAPAETAEPAPVEEQPVEAAEPAAETPAEGDVYPEATTMNQVVAILKGRGVAASRLRSKQGVVNEATALGLSFPNVKAMQE